MKGKVEQLCLEILKEYYKRRGRVGIRVTDITKKITWKKDVYPTPRELLNILKGFYDDGKANFLLVEIYEKNIKRKYPISPGSCFTPIVVPVNAKPFLIVPMYFEFYLFLDRTIEGFTLIRCEFN